MSRPYSGATWRAAILWCRWRQASAVQGLWIFLSPAQLTRQTREGLLPLVYTCWHVGREDGPMHQGGRGSAAFDHLLLR